MITIEGALGTSFRDLAAAPQAAGRGAKADALATANAARARLAARGVQGGEAPLGQPLATSVGRSKGPVALSANAIKLVAAPQASGQPPVVSPAATPRPPMEIPPPAAAVFPPMADFPAASVIAPPSSVSQEEIAVTASIAPRRPGAAEPTPEFHAASSTPSTAVLVVGGLVVLGAAYYFLRKG